MLAIDTTCSRTSIAVGGDDGNFFIEYGASNNSHVESFFKILNTLFDKYNYHYGKIKNLVVVAGPGSFTGIRVGISAAQGISLAISKPLYGVNALEVQAYAISLSLKKRENVKSIVESAQGIYEQLFDVNLLPISKPQVISKDYMSNKPREFNAGHAGLLALHRIAHGQELNKAEALYLHEPEYIK